MIFDDDKDEYTLASGRVLYANLGIFGLGPTDGTPNAMTTGGLYNGYDGVYYEGDPSDTADSDGRTRALTPDERREIAVEMIARWRAWGRLP